MKRLMVMLGAVLAAGVIGLQSQPAQAKTVTDIITGGVCSSTSNQLAGCGPNDKNLTGCDSSGQNCDPTKSYLNTLINAFQYIAIAIATIFIFIGGINYITSEGDSTKAENAIKTIRYAVIAIVIAVAARALAAFVIEAANKTK